MVEENEIWKTFYFNGIETYYMVSNYGRVKSIERKVKDKNLLGSGEWKIIQEKILKPNPERNGYLRYKLHIESRPHMFLGHRLTALVFIENKDNLKEVHHKDDNKQNNFYKNLQWCTRSFNMKDAFKKGLMNICKPETHPQSKTVGRYLNGELIKTYINATEAEKEGFKQSLISRAAIKGMTHGGFFWKYCDNNKKLKLCRE